VNSVTHMWMKNSKWSHTCVCMCDTWMHNVTHLCILSHICEGWAANDVTHYATHDNVTHLWHIIMSHICSNSQMFVTRNNVTCVNSEFTNVTLLYVTNICKFVRHHSLFVVHITNVWHYYVSQIHKCLWHIIMSHICEFCHTYVNDE